MSAGIWRERVLQNTFFVGSLTPSTFRRADDLSSSNAPSPRTYSHVHLLHSPIRRRARRRARRAARAVGQGQRIVRAWTPVCFRRASAARCVSARFASDARLPVTALRAGQAHCRARRGVSARAEGSSGAQYGEVRPTPRFKKCENAPRENQQHAVHSKERKTRQLPAPPAAPSTSPRSPASYPQRFADVDRVLVSYFTFRALKETLSQIQQTDLSPNKAEYKWLYVRV